MSLSHDHAPAAIPAHVPPELVVDDFPLVFGASTTENPFQTMIPKIHEGPEIFYSTNVYPGAQPGWVIRRQEDVRAVYLDTEHFSNQGFSPFARLIGETWQMVPAESDPPNHTAHRMLLNPLFTPKKMAALDGTMRDYARQYIAKFKDRGVCEFMGDFAFRFPIAVFLDLIGLPQDNVEQFLEWEKGLLHESDITKVADAARNVVGYLRGEIEDRRRNPKDDFITFGVQAEIDGKPLSDDDLMGFCFGMYIGGLDTVSSNMGLHFRHLAENPEHQRRLRENPAFIPTALEELLRVYATSTTFRTCTQAQTVRGMTIMPGDRVAMNTSIANHDPLAYDNPSQVDLDRDPTHITFAYGIHRCIGSHLARRELVVAMEEMFAAVPEFRLAPGVPIVSSLGGMIAPHELPLVW